MPIEIVVPRLGWSMERGTLVAWLKQPGEFVRAGEMLFQLEGEKAVQDIESFDEGILCLPEDTPPPGSDVQVGQVLAYLLAAGEPAISRIAVIAESSPSLAIASTDAAVNETIALPNNPDPVAGPAARRLARELHVDLRQVMGTGKHQRVLTEDIRRYVEKQQALLQTKDDRGRVLASPRARRLAHERAVPLDSLHGTGRNGRIRERDVMTMSHAAPATALYQDNEEVTIQAASRLRRTIATKMSAGVHEAAPVTLVRKIRVDALVDYRKRLKAELVSGDVPTVNDLLLFATCQSLLEHPKLNAHWRDSSLHLFRSVHLAFGVDAPEGLKAPVIRNADSLSLSELMREARRLADAVRTGKATDAELIGGTFSVTNLGGMGIDAFTPILNLPQVAILGVGRAVQEPVVDADAVVPGWTMQLSLTFDHRAIDGADGARFLQTLAELVGRDGLTQRR
jgi:pyruvate dehydrogenase E2 component (dihydrolipoamide acetyltransferase)